MWKIAPEFQKYETMGASLPLTLKLLSLFLMAQLNWAALGIWRRGNKHTSFQHEQFNGSFTSRAIEALKLVHLTLILSFLVLQEQLVHNFFLQLNHCNAVLFLFKICIEKMAGKSNIFIKWTDKLLANTAQGGTYLYTQLQFLPRMRSEIQFFLIVYYHI